ncbi:MAG: polyamine aminopropyltransferase [Sulfuricella sp.]|nr:polyamine aminopropyltransferase [Sulfuricella sp.]
MTAPATADQPLNRVVIFSVFVVASCGLTYELIAGALASYLLGDSVLQFSSIIGAYLCAMGIGSHVSRYVKDRVAERFVDIEIAVGLIGGVAAALLFVAFAWAQAFRPLLYALVAILGILVGMEIPLVMRLLNERKAEFSELVANVLTFDYLGALAVSLLFPLLLAPKLGLMRTGFLFGMLNVGVALLTIQVFRNEPGFQARGRWIRGIAVLVFLMAGFQTSERLTGWVEKGIFGDEVIHAKSTPYQRIVVTRWKDDLRLWLNGNLQFSSRDEHRYHEALVHPGLASLPWARRVLVLGGGDGMAVREVLKYPDVEAVTLVDLDQGMTDLFTHSPELVKLNQGSLKQPKVKVVNADAGKWLEQSDELFDFVIVDFPDPSNYSLGKLYSVSFYRLLKKHLAASGLAVIQATSPYNAPHAYWSVDASLREAGWHTWPYHALVPSFGEWGYLLAGQGYRMPDKIPVATRFLTPEVLKSLFLFPPDMARTEVEPNRLDNQPLVRYFEEDWAKVIR